MVGLNRVLLAGNLTRDPDVRYTAGGQAVGDLDLAINNTYLSKNGEKRTDTVYVHAVVWGKQAENAKNYLSKGSPLLIEGRLQQDSWESRDGQKRSRIVVVANRLQFLGTPGGEAGRSASRTGTPAAQSSSSREDDLPY
jgi:single-strand DNA-binding protein